MMINIDDFKLYNQLYGMKEGDTALQNVAKIISAAVRERGFVARYSGKEFAAALPEFDVLAAGNVAESIRMAPLFVEEGKNLSEREALNLEKRRA